MELNTFDEVNLFEDVEQENEKYINILEALKLVVKKIDYGISDIAKRLLLDGFNKNAPLFKMNDYGKIEIYCSEKDFKGDYVTTTEFLKEAISTSGTFTYVETDHFGNEYEHAEEDWIDYYWLKSDFFNFSRIKKLEISEEYYNLISKEESENAAIIFLAKLGKEKQERNIKEITQAVSRKFFEEKEFFEQVGLIDNKTMDDAISNCDISTIDNSHPQHSSSLQKAPPPSIIPSLPTREESQTQEIELLKADLSKAQERIKELEQKQKSDEELYKFKIFIAESKKDPEIRKQQEKISHFGGIIDQQAKEIANLKQRLFGVEALREKFKIPETPEQEITNSKTRNSVSILIATLCELNNMDITQPHGEPNKLILDTAELLGAKLGKDFVGKWLKLAKENIK